MASWNNDPPRGHPMEGTEKFPGALYPPDHEKGPSPNTPFAVALKRACAKIGAWPWDPDGWDEAFSNRFAHGEGYEHATHAGLQAVQRWSGSIDPTGNCGEKTYNFLRSVLVPQGRTHAGDPAWDSVCQNLTAQANDQQETHPETTIRQAAVKLAISQLGYHETGNNDNKYGAWYGENFVPWCAIFSTWCYLQSDHPAGLTFQTVKQASNNDRYDYVPYIVADARSSRWGTSVTSSPLPGDLVCYDWNWNGEYDHVGLFEAWDENVPGVTFTAIEGNTSPSNNSNGGEVMRRTRNRNAQGTVFVRVREP